MALPDDQINSLTLRWANGNASAAEFLQNICHCARLADDIADGDSSDPAKDMFNLLNRAFVTNSNNEFFNQHKETLCVAITTSLAMWLKSEEWKNSSNRKTRMFGFVYREGIDHCAWVVASLVKGPVHALRVIEELHAISHEGDDESFEDWESEETT